MFDRIHRKGYQQTLLIVSVGKWTNITAYYRRSPTDTGQITVWQDGVKLFDLNHVQTAIADDVVWGSNNNTDEITPRMRRSTSMMPRSASRARACGVP